MESWNTKPTVPLATVRNGSKAKIVKISGRDEVRRHLSVLGFTVGEEVSVLSETNGNMVVDIRGTRVAIDNSLTARIMVSSEASA